VLVNPSITADTPLFAFLPVMKYVVPSTKGIASDIKKAGATELAYTRVPLKAAATLPGLWRVTKDQLGDVTQPVLVYRSAVDHVVKPRSVQILRDSLAGGVLEVRDCADSYHVATLDNDAQAIFTGSLDFVRAHSRAGKG
jgi:carboxylesterase